MTEHTDIEPTATSGELTEMLRGDQRLRWQQGQRVPVEAYFEHYPQLQSDTAAIRELILGELRLRRELGASFDLDELKRRFPDDAEWVTAQVLRLNRIDSRDDTSLADEDPEADAPWPVLPGFEILEEVGRGGMGLVYRAHQHRLNRTVALKVLLGGTAASAKVRARFRAEAEAVARLQHPYIVQIFDVIEQDGQLVLALEYVGGGSLADRIRAGLQPFDSVAECVRKLAQAMHFAHERGILHRDLKPSNVLLTEDGIPKVTDFGLAKRLGDDTSRTQTGTVLGTPDYMSPEQAEGRVRDLGPATDVYALGCILYELLTGAAPFRGEAMLRVLDAVRFKKPAAPSSIRPDVPRPLERICLKCLEKLPANRYASAAELADDLGRFLNGEPVRAASSSPWTRLRSWFSRF